MGAAFLSFWCYMGKPEDSRRYPLGLQRSFGRPKKEKGVASKPFSLFWTISKARNKIVFKDEIFSMLREKTSFLLLETRKHYIGWSFKYSLVY